MSVLDNLYHYKFKVDRVIDGDAIVGKLDQGRKIYNEDVRIRLLGIDAPEVRTKDFSEKKRGLAAKEYLESLILGKYVVVRTEKDDDDDSFGRMLADVFLTDGTDIHVNQLMIINGHAVER